MTTHQIDISNSTIPFRWKKSTWKAWSKRFLSQSLMLDFKAIYLSDKQTPSDNSSTLIDDNQEQQAS